MNKDKIFILVMHIIFGIMYIAIVAALIWGIVQVNKGFSKETTEEVQLYSISTDKEYEGSFVLCSQADKLKTNADRICSLSDEELEKGNDKTLNRNTDNYER